MDICKSCEQKRKIVNKHFHLCIKCNENRLHVNKTKNSVNIGKDTKANKTPFLRAKNKPKQKKSLFSKTYQETKSTKDKIKEDENFYRECFNMSDHRCEECNTPLPDEFEDSNGKVIARFRYSHIIPKSIAPELRHNTSNINHLCLECHGIWENGDKVNMSIFEENFKRFPNYLNKFINK